MEGISLLELITLLEVLLCVSPDLFVASRFHEIRQLLPRFAMYPIQLQEQLMLLIGPVPILRVST